MNRGVLLDALKGNSIAVSPTAAELELVLERYPYFQAPRYLLLRLLKAGDDHRFQEEVRKAAVQCTHRDHLYSFLHPVAQKAAPVEGEQTDVNDTFDVTDAPTHLEEELLVEEVKPSEVVAVAPEIPSPPIPVLPLPIATEDGPIARLKRNLLLDIAQVEAPNDLLSQILSYPEVAREQDPGSLEPMKPTIPEVQAMGERKSFSAWLKAVPGPAAKSEQPTRDSSLPIKEKSQSALPVAAKPAVDRDDLVSETLAQVYAKQGDTARAIRIYEKLSLIYPEKSAYFAGLVEKLVKNP
jgi:hypothetical protein